MSAIAKAKDAYEHVDPESVGNGTRFVVSELAGRSHHQAEGATSSACRSTAPPSAT